VNDDDSFVIANRAFELMNLAERERVLGHFARLRFPSIIDRFVESVHFVITEPLPPPPSPESAT
jgi:hypothetical protein